MLTECRGVGLTNYEIQLQQETKTTVCEPIRLVRPQQVNRWPSLMCIYSAEFGPKKDEVNSKLSILHNEILYSAVSNDAATEWTRKQEKRAGFWRGNIMERAHM